MHSKVLDELRPRATFYMTHRQLSAADMPVGAPWTGPAFGQKNGPAVALFGAFQAISVGMTIGGLTGGLMIAGGVLGGLGSLTGNKTLQKLGMVAGLAGAVGQFFSPAVGGFEGMSNAWNAGEGISGGLSNMADQFMGNANFGAGLSGMAPVVDSSNALMNVGATPLESLGGALTGPSAAIGVQAAGAAPQVNAAKLPVGGVPGTGGKDGKGGLLGLWDKQSDFTKYGMINAAGGALKGMGEADAAEEQRKADEPLRDAQTNRANAETALLNKKADGPAATSVGNFGTREGATPFGKNADGTSRSYDQYIADRTEAFRKLFGEPQTAPA